MDRQLTQTLTALPGSQKNTPFPVQTIPGPIWHRKPRRMVFVTVFSAALQQHARESSQERPTMPPQQPHNTHVSEAAVAHLYGLFQKAQGGIPVTVTLESFADTLHGVLTRLSNDYPGIVEQVHVADDARLAEQTIVLDVIVNTGTLSYSLYRKMAEHVFAEVDDADFLLQFRLVTPDEWRQTPHGFDLLLLSRT